MGKKTQIGIIAAGLAVTAGVAATISAAAVASPDKESEEKPSKAVVAALFNEWNASLATGDPQKVADRYAPDAVLVPTVSNQVRTDRAGIVNYFQEFLKKKPQGKITSSFVNVLDDDDAIDTGTYTFSLTVDGKQKTVPARYTFVYELRDGKWLIVNHHSSAMPESS